MLFGPPSLRFRRVPMTDGCVSERQQDYSLNRVDRRNLLTLGFASIMIRGVAQLGSAYGSGP